MGIFDDVDTLVCKRGERGFVGSWMLDGPLDWGEVLPYWIKYVRYCKRHHIVIGRHEEVKICR